MVESFTTKLATMAGAALPGIALLPSVPKEEMTEARGTPARALVEKAQ